MSSKEDSRISLENFIRKLALGKFQTTLPFVTRTERACERNFGHLEPFGNRYNDYFLDSLVS